MRHKWIIVLIIISILAVSSYCVGYAFGQYLGHDLTNIIEQDRADRL